MSQANHAHTLTTTRRSIIAGVAATIPAAAVAAPAAINDHDQDAALLALGREWEVAVAASDAASRSLGDDDDAFDAAAPIWGHESDLQAKIVPLPARTMAGLRLKARVAQRSVEMPLPSGDKRTALEYLIETCGPASSEAATMAVVLDLLAMPPSA